MKKVISITPIDDFRLIVTIQDLQHTKSEKISKSNIFMALKNGGK